MFGFSQTKKKKEKKDNGLKYRVAAQLKMSNVLVAELLFKVISISFDIFSSNTNKGKNVKLKGNNVEQKEKMSTFAKSLFDIFT